MAKRVNKNVDGKDTSTNKRRNGNRRIAKDVEEKYAANKICDWQKSRDNDPRWYSLNDQLLFDTANIPYSWPLGSKLDFGPYGSGLNNIAAPGVMAFYTMPTIGISTDATSAVNTASNNIYSYVRHANSGAKNYEAPDLMMYLLAMDSMYSLISWMKRIYGVISNYNPENYYYPRAVVEAMNVDFADIQQNLADFRAYINMLCVKVGSLCIPASMSYMAKHMWLYEGIYLDDDSPKAQSYMFNPYGFLKYDRDPDSNATNLTFIPMTGLQTGKLTRSDIYAVAEEMFNAIMLDEDAGIMSGDILKAFGRENVFKLEQISEIYTVTPEYSMEVLDQIQNIITIGDLFNDSVHAVNHKGTVVVSQNLDIDNGYISSNPTFAWPDEVQAQNTRPGGLNYLVSNKFLTFPYEKVTTYNTMEGSRLTASVDDSSISYDTSAKMWKWKAAAMGSEVVAFARIFFYGLQNPYSSTPGPNFVLLNTEKFHTGHSLAIEIADATPTSSPADYASRILSNFNYYNYLLTMITQFDRHPALVPSVLVRSGNSITGPFNLQGRSTTNGVILDLSTYAIVTPEVLENMNKTALISEFNVRQFGLKDNMSTSILN